MAEWVPYLEIFDDENIQTKTSIDQINTEKAVSNAQKGDKTVLRIPSRDYLIDKIVHLGKSYQNFCYQETWLPYWFLNSMYVLKLHKIGGFDFFKDSIIKYLSKRTSYDGGYASSPDQKGNIILTYTAINSLAIIGTEKAFSSINRSEIYNFLKQSKQPDGSFSAGAALESDSRSTYCAICVASLLNMLTPELLEGTVEFLISCQGYDGGFGPRAHCETHGGYGFCSLGALSILNSIDKINVEKVINWCAMRQTSYAGGFNGRTNKLVDTCYTWWVGAMCRILSDEFKIEPFWNQEGITNWVLSVCQHESGGAFDKPGVNPDLFHTMYGYIGLSASANDYLKKQGGFELIDMDARYAIPKESVEAIKNYFANNPFTP
ncbi:Prenyltransferase and squalene oxidase repeat family protein [Trichomonas vaginalis G3]|uniref:Prenyltransferase and squalene oxidase repeat family protein n=1 Tax=Trichomonas vaginalis (strain ATCC PRA-98 / G3) TaxID=412133 RepID=A2DLV2_TRIV3|nr:protein farnesylation [Trichomonas vaginalis G3]EAY18555.1 Prenyltransferase and squalene oxidase repeat family protein [Trichomonas vaginalis G3]KAI5491578.1 protein farnesylation [Trichomonas vaginalis G3]|eukprot:XP_001579541.1 Prenyltransferase and squalene oxidase repeat family protein [Trichomonas vaginalis G3]